MTPERILLFSTTMGLGGADKQVSLLSQELDARGYDTQVVSLRPVGKMGRNLREHGIPVKSLQIDRTVQAPQAVARLRRHVRDFDSDILHSHMFHANMVARATRSVTPVDGVISTAHNVYESPPDEGGKGGVIWREQAYRITDPLADLTTNVADAGIDRYVNLGLVPESKAKRVYNGLDVDEFRSDDDAVARVRDECEVKDKFVWLAVGRFYPQKDYSTMLAAMETDTDVGTLWIVGHGEQETQLKREAEARRIEDRVHFLGTVSSVKEYMSAADGYVLSSKWEGLPMVLIEAMACGLPIVATRAGGTVEAVVDGETGYLVPPAAPKKLASAMQRLRNLKPEQRQRLGEAGRERARRLFDIRSVTEEWESVYQSVCDGTPSRTADRRI